MHFELERRLDARRADGAVRPRARDPLRRPGRRCATSREMRARVPAMVARPRARRRPATPPTRSRRPSRSSTGCSRTTSCSSATASTRSTPGRSRSCRAPGSASSPTRRRATTREPMPLVSIEPQLRERITGGDLLLVSKTNRFSTVHRHVRMDYVGVKRVGDDGAVARRDAPDRPVHEQGLRRAGRPRPDPAPQAAPDHRGRGPDRGHARLQGGRRAVRVVPEGRPVRRHRRRPPRRGDGAAPSRRAPPGEAVRAPRRRGSRGRRHRRAAARPLQRRSCSSGCRSCSWPASAASRSTSTCRSARASRRASTSRCTSPAPIPDVPLGDLEHEVVALTRTWDDRLRERLVATYGEERGVRLAETYRERFPDYYKNSTDISMALVDVEQFERLGGAASQFRVALQNERGGPQDLTRVGIYKTGGKVQLSEVLPILENLGLQVDEEVPTRLQRRRRRHLPAQLRRARRARPAARPRRLRRPRGRLHRRRLGTARPESDALDRLIISAGLTWQPGGGAARVPQVPPARRRGSFRSSTRTPPSRGTPTCRRSSCATSRCGSTRTGRSWPARRTRCARRSWPRSTRSPPSTTTASSATTSARSTRRCARTRSWASRTCRSSSRRRRCR